MQKVTIGYEPSAVLGYFEEISAIPRGSGNEEAVANYVYNWGKDLGLDAYKDEHHNVVLKKAASKGYEGVAPIMLQGHLDIVPVKLPGCDHDFEKDPLPLYVEDGKLRSRGTTLGADNGNAIAYMMGVLADNEIIHPPLECIFTAAEEIGLVGASKLDKNSFTAKRMINMDAGGLDMRECTVSCAGGLELKMTQPAKWIKGEGEFIKLSITGLQGGHSAIAIHVGRGNGAKLMSRIINRVSLHTKTSVASFFGGDKMNAIVSACDAVISVADKAVALEKINATIKEIKEELSVTDKGFNCKVEEIAPLDKMLDLDQSKRMMQFILTIPSTVRDMSFEIEGHPLNSNNLGAVQLCDEQILVWTLGRSGDDSRMAAMGEEVMALADVFGYDVQVGASFSGWKYNPNSELRKVHKELFMDVFGLDLFESATHGGLECGVFYGLEPEMDTICFGPISDGAHTPEEYVDLKSFNEMYCYLVRLLEVLAKNG